MPGSQKTVEKRNRPQDPPAGQQHLCPRQRPSKLMDLVKMVEKQEPLHLEISRIVSWLLRSLLSVLSRSNNNTLGVNCLLHAGCGVEITLCANLSGRGREEKSSWSAMALSGQKCL